MQFLICEDHFCGQKKANKLKNCIIANNKYFGIYGYVMLNDKSNLIGAILFFYNEYLNNSINKSRF